MAKDGTKRSTSYQGIGGKRGYSDSSLTRAANEPVIGMSLFIVLCGLLIVTLSAGRDRQQRLNFHVRFVSPFNPKSKSGATSLLQTAENLNRTVRWRGPFCPELCGSVTFGCGNWCQRRSICVHCAVLPQCRPLGSGGFPGVVSPTPQRFSLRPRLRPRRAGKGCGAPCRD